MERQLVQAGGSLAVTLPAEIVKEFKLKKGMSVEVTIHPQTRAVTIRPGVRMFEDGKVTKRFEKLSEAILNKYEDAFAELAK
jgi:antitoxin component of MazEF toxin-antitoxin module